MQTIQSFFKKLFSGFNLSTPVAILLGAILISVSHIAYGALLSGKASTPTLELFKGRPIDSTDLAVGNTKSDIVVVEYSDTECQFCAQLHPTIQKIQEEYSGKISFVYRYFPLTQIHPDAFDEARAIHCVGSVAGAEKKMEYVNEMFTYKIAKQNMVLPKGGRLDLAKNIGVDAKKYNECMAGEEAGNVVNASTQDGITAGVEGTPATFILMKSKKGYEVVAKVDGARPFQFFKAILDDALAR